MPLVWIVWISCPKGIGDIITHEMKRLQLIIATSTCAFGCALLAAGLITPPMGEIHHSVLIALGEILTFSGSLIGIDYHYRYKE